MVTAKAIMFPFYCGDLFSEGSPPCLAVDRVERPEVIADIPRLSAMQVATWLRRGEETYLVSIRECEPEGVLSAQLATLAAMVADGEVVDSATTPRIIGEILDVNKGRRPPELLPGLQKHSGVDQKIVLEPGT